MSNLVKKKVVQKVTSNKVISISKTNAKQIQLERPIKNVTLARTGAQGPKGDPGLTPEEVDQRIDERLEENKLVFRDIAGNIYENGD